MSKRNHKTKRLLALALNLLCVPNTGLRAMEKQIYGAPPRRPNSVGRQVPNENQNVVKTAALSVAPQGVPSQQPSMPGQPQGMPNQPQGMKRSNSASKPRTGSSLSKKLGIGTILAGGIVGVAWGGLNSCLRGGNYEDNPEYQRVKKRYEGRRMFDSLGINKLRHAIAEVKKDLDKFPDDGSVLHEKIREVLTHDLHELEFRLKLMRFGSPIDKPTPPVPGETPEQPDEPGEQDDYWAQINKYNEMSNKWRDMQETIPNVEKILAEIEQKLKEVKDSYVVIMYEGQKGSYQWKLKRLKRDEEDKKKKLEQLKKDEEERQRKKEEDEARLKKEMDEEAAKELAEKLDRLRRQKEEEDRQKQYYAELAKRKKEEEEAEKKAKAERDAKEKEEARKRKEKFDKEFAEFYTRLDKERAERLRKEKEEQERKKEEERKRKEEEERRRKEKEQKEIERRAREEEERCRKKEQEEEEARKKKEQVDKEYQEKLKKIEEEGKARAKKAQEEMAKIENEAKKRRIEAEERAASAKLQRELEKLKNEQRLKDTMRPFPMADACFDIRGAFNYWKKDTVDRWPPEVKSFLREHIHASEATLDKAFGKNGYNRDFVIPFTLLDILGISSLPIPFGMIGEEYSKNGPKLEGITVKFDFYPKKDGEEKDYFIMYSKPIIENCKSIEESRNFEVKICDCIQWNEGKQAANTMYYEYDKSDDKESKKKVKNGALGSYHSELWRACCERLKASPIYYDVLRSLRHVYLTFTKKDGIPHIQALIGPDIVSNYDFVYPDKLNEL